MSRSNRKPLWLFALHVVAGVSASVTVLLMLSLVLGEPAFDKLMAFTGMLALSGWVGSLMEPAFR